MTADTMKSDMFKEYALSAFRAALMDQGHGVLWPDLKEGLLLVTADRRLPLNVVFALQVISYTELERFLFSPLRRVPVITRKVVLGQDIRVHQLGVDSIHEEVALDEDLHRMLSSSLNQMAKLKLHVFPLLGTSPASVSKDPLA